MLVLYLYLYKIGIVFGGYGKPTATRGKETANYEIKMDQIKTNNFFYSPCWEISINQSIKDD
jgi:hypothetical protein